MNFKSFFNQNTSQPHHRSIKRITNMDRDHLNIVAKSQSPYQYKNSALDSADLNGAVFLCSVNNPKKAQDLALQYGLNIDKEDKDKPFEKQLKDSGKFLKYVPNKGYYILTK